MTEADRIRLAHAIGPELVNIKLFVPEHDANDDYEVLKFARDNWIGSKQWDQFCEGLIEDKTLYGSLLFYTPGCYSRAALKVIDDGA